MAARCFVCGGKRTHPTHLRAVAGAGYHEYQDSSPAGLQGKSEGRRNYERSQAHQKAYEHVEGQCIFFAGGAPNHVCFGPITPGHVVSRTVAGSLEEADKYPVAPECKRANTDVDADPELRKWAEEHIFMWHDGRLYRYRYDRAHFERELLNGYIAPEAEGREFKPVSSTSQKEA